MHLLPFFVFLLLSPALPSELQEIAKLGFSASLLCPLSIVHENYDDHGTAPF